MRYNVPIANYFTFKFCIIIGVGINLLFCIKLGPKFN